MNEFEQEITSFNMQFFRLDGKTAIVTGGNSGLGQGFALALAKAGADIFIVTLEDDAGGTKELIEAEGVRCHVKTADITQDGVCREVVDECLATFGQLDILMNNAGIGINEKDVTKYTRLQWDKMVSINLTAPFELASEAAKHMIEKRSGKIINTCSLFSFLGGRWSPAYAATKHGLAGFTKAYCDELAQFNIQVNGIAPGYFATDVTKATREDEASNSRILDHVPAGRWGQIIDLMGTVVYLASDASNYVNGTLITVDGGYLVR
ncbi:NAD(P)-dependent dehydrogenase (short-subunit alcohol dehydrogenase family) [Salsuginibacillus halophilus]|uniref:NAD(P)-dependent dehydrogenase (Short-subunit alcohol dehydrogenase family) n=1 Tax=Salsuginibacillus halophilus TaxID=517424 RepID=A0A2P8HL72_9BACI|nr:SDR family NAD(P)-dependent oxidoreductase [Salsuginibacillus halophilus]PSL46951.1 NAD(P)-dependent dehydrogenase (short-subunit alcohol dehydrogenase family) [Salsuginibacillus halophilus]